MQIKSFDDLKTAGLQQENPQRLLMVLLRAEPDDDTRPSADEKVIEGSGHLVPVMATDRELTPELRLDVLAEEADKVGQPWDLILVSSLSAEGRLPSSEEAEPYLKKMAEAVEHGADLSGYAVFDRAGSPVRLQSNLGAE
ncbi:hypothetical protein DFR31_1867 [Alkalispirillum mobile]|uniref:Uncharacterized protein n=1 Tax=Alkalispirillum mobile TaxID=85925 RepID=A0A498C2B5_9GAMM|nr:hypothetical protein [Alkalispirillum mobile]RLK48756.1 hypothetical protein DFR31_1867 [Alkalispirillum mobile]